MKCPDCGGPVETGQDFCLECGEPIAGFQVPAPPSSHPAIAAPVPTAPRPAPPAVAAAKPKVRKFQDEPDPIRCPACGIPSRRERCPGCGVRLRSNEE